MRPQMSGEVGRPRKHFATKLATIAILGFTTGGCQAMMGAGWVSGPVPRVV